jgi:hypothetical protein
MLHFVNAYIQGKKKMAQTDDTKLIEDTLTPHVGSPSDMAEALYSLAGKLKTDSNLARIAQTSAREFLRRQFYYAKDGFSLLEGGSRKRAFVFYVMQTMHHILDDTDDDPYTKTTAYQKMKASFESFQVEDSGRIRPRPEEESTRLKEAAEGGLVGDEDETEQMMFDEFYGQIVQEAPEPNYDYFFSGGLPESMKEDFEAFFRKLPKGDFITSKRRILYCIAVETMGDISIADSPGDLLDDMPSIYVRNYDPITGMRITYPVVGKNCKHIEVFDARTYYMLFVAMQQPREVQNICLICRQPLPVEELYYDQMMVFLLGKSRGLDDAFRIKLNDCY